MTQPKAITCPCILTSASTRSDGSLSLRFSTPELDPPSKTAFFELLNLNLKLLLQPLDSEPAEFHEVKNQFDTKTPSQRLRSIIFLLYKQSGESGEFEDHYRRVMESIITTLKQKLEDK